jgi:hypothetical protein
LASQSPTQAKTWLEGGTHGLFFLNAFIFRQFLVLQRKSKSPLLAKPARSGAPVPFHFCFIFDFKLKS